MKASQMHLWIFQALEPLKAETWAEMDRTIGATTPSEEHAYYLAAGRHQGLVAAIGAALDLVGKLQDEEREAAQLSR